MTSSSFQKFVALLYKGFLLRKRHYIVTAFEIVFPVLIASIPVIINSEISVPPDVRYNSGGGWVNDTVTEPFDPLSSGPAYITRWNPIHFVYAPSNKYTKLLMEESIELWKSSDVRFASLKGLSDADDLENYCVTLKKTNESLRIIGTVFNNIPSDAKKFPSVLDYTIRYSSDNNFFTSRKYRFSKTRYDSSIYSEKSFFLSWQASVEETFIKKKMIEEKKMLNYKLWMQEFPFPAHRAKDGFPLYATIGVMILYGFMVFVMNMIRRVIEEKSNGSKELMKMMGMTNFLYWFSTFLNFFIVGALVFLIIAALYKLPMKNSAVLLQNTNFILLYIIFLLFLASLILFCFAITTFFNKAIFGIIFMVILYNVVYSLLSSLVFGSVQGGGASVVEVVYYPLSLFGKFCICLTPFGSLCTLTQLIMDYENSGEGLQWSNLFKSEIIPDFNVFWFMFAMLFSCLLYGIITWYVDAVWPWQYGVPKPFYFPFMKSYWFGYQKNRKNDDILLNSDQSVENHEFFENDPVGISPGVVISNLSKTFRSGFQTKVAVNNVSLNIYTGQITALLGHNGAGKTTTINILTGLYSPSSGTASINGWDIFSQTAKARQSLGLCPQHNVLYDTLTVEEHLKLYAALKGVDWKQLNQETNSVLNLLFLADKKTELAKNLSGGMKRKLSLGIAVIGGSKVLFLDEPTSGMDVEARRSVWDTLLQLRHNCTIVLTTHYMEEADILGDRIAIMADGEIQCCGSPLFLKKKFGTGYHLHLVKEDKFDMNAVRNLLAKYIPGATLVNEYEREATFNLMSNAHSKFGEMFEEIEKKKHLLGVNSCGITVTTMEDVFLNVSNLADLKLKSSDKQFSLENDDETEMKDIYVELNRLPKTLPSYFQNFGNQFLGLIMKRFHYSKRHWNVVITQLILPFLVMCGCLATINSTKYDNSSKEPPLNLDIKEVYGKTDGFYNFDSGLILGEIQEVFKENSISAKNVKNSTEFILNYGRESIADYYKRLMMGASGETLNGTLNVTAWFNGYPYHAEPVSLSLMNTAILRHVVESGSISLTNSPLPNVNTYFRVDSLSDVGKIMAMVFVPLALSFLSASFVLVPIHERASRSKLLQIMTGVSPVTYWLSMFAWDLLMSVVVSVLLILPFAFFSHYAFFSPHSEAIGTAILLFILYAWASIPFSYLLSLIFLKPNTGFNVVTLIHAITGSAVCSTFTPLTSGSYIRNKPAVKFFYWFLKFFPGFALASGFGNLFGLAYTNGFCDSISQNDLEYNCLKNDSRSPIFKCCKDICGSQCLNETSPLTLDYEGCGRDLLFLLLDGFFYLLILLGIEEFNLGLLCQRAFQHLYRRLRSAASTVFAQNNFSEDSDVLQEEERIRNNLSQVCHSDALVVHNLTKVFKSIRAVDRLTFGIHRKECFGLLGVNGAGKTTTFKMLVGDCFPTEGNAYISNYSVTNNLKKFQSHLGYCPQFDALIDRLSARETITLFARLRGMRGASMIRYVNALIKMTDLTQYADKPSMVYSGGNKRKLSIALALIGAPPLLLLDEPTAGVDPVSRRKIWKILSLARNYSGAAVILTTHSMEESEALCSRLAIMVNGRFRCLGSIQQLKSKFGKGYTLIIKLKNEEQAIPQSMNAVKSYIETNLPRAQLKDDHQGMLQYHVVDDSVTLGYLFRFMDEMKPKYNLEDYIISDTSLEQIFLAFARSQRVVAV